MNRLFIYILLLLAVSCEVNRADRLSVDERFAAAVVDSSRELSDVDLDGYSLVSIKYKESPLTEWKIIDGDTLVLVSTLQNCGWEYERLEVGESLTTSQSPDNTLWVTIPGEFNDKLLSEKVLADSTALNNRLLEIIGLRPDDKNSVVSLFWIDKNNLLRPSYNPDPTTKYGAINYPSNLAPEWYREWFDGNIAYSYESPADGLNYPFTRLGYTYDWGAGSSKYGLSEFVTMPSSRMILESRLGCWSYYQELLRKH